MTGFLEKFSLFTKSNNNTKNSGPELHLQRMKRIQKFLGNITDKELKQVEIKFEDLSQKFSYPIWEISSLYEWLYKSYSIKNPESIFIDLEKAVKTAKTLGRSHLRMKKSDLDGVITS